MTINKIMAIFVAFVVAALFSFSASAEEKLKLNRGVAPKKPDVVRSILEWRIGKAGGVDVTFRFEKSGCEKGLCFKWNADEPVPQKGGDRCLDVIFSVGDNQLPMKKVCAKVGENWHSPALEITLANQIVKFYQTRTRVFKNPTSVQRAREQMNEAKAKLAALKKQYPGVQPQEALVAAFPTLAGKMPKWVAKTPQKPMPKGNAAPVKTVKAQPLAAPVVVSAKPASQVKVEIPSSQPVVVPQGQAVKVVIQVTPFLLAEELHKALKTGGHYEKGNAYLRVFTKGSKVLNSSVRMEDLEAETLYKAVRVIRVGMGTYDSKEKKALVYVTDGGKMFIRR